MAGLMDGGVAAAFAAVFGGIYVNGQLYRPNAFTDDGMGGGIGSGFAPPEAVKVQIDAVTDAMRSAEGYVDGDVRILMLAHGLVAPDTDCELSANNTRWMVESVSIDPCGSYYELRGRRKLTSA